MGQVRLQPAPLGPESFRHSGTLGQPGSSPEPRMARESVWLSLGNWARFLVVSDPPSAPEQRLAHRYCQERPPVTATVTLPRPESVADGLVSEVGDLAPPSSCLQESRGPSLLPCVQPGSSHVSEQGQYWLRVKVSENKEEQVRKV